MPSAVVGAGPAKEEFASRKPLVKISRLYCAMKDRSRRATAGGDGASDRAESRSNSQVVASSSVAGVSCDACEAKYPWPRLHGQRGTSTPPGRDAVSS